MTNSRQKGARGEREVASLYREAGFEARRGQQYSGTTDSPDVVVEDAPGLWTEVKFRQRLNIYLSMREAAHGSGEDKTPILWHRKNGEDWLVTMRDEDWLWWLRGMLEQLDYQGGKR